MITKKYNYKGQDLKITFRGFVNHSHNGKIIKSVQVHIKMINHIIDNYSHLNPKNIHCSYENDTYGVFQYTLSCDIKDGYIHLNQDFFDYVKKGKLNMFVNQHINSTKQ